MHGCIIWRCKPTAAKARFHWIFRVLLQRVPISTPKWPFPGKAPPCEPRPLCLICNSRWTPSREDRVTDTPYHVRAGTGLIISMKTRAPCSCSTRILYHPVRQRCHGVRSAICRRQTSSSLCHPCAPLWRNHYILATKRGFAAGTERHKVLISGNKHQMPKTTLPQTPTPRRPKLIRPGSPEGPGRRLGTPPQQGRNTSL